MVAAQRVAFIRAATWHGDLREAESILAEEPALRQGDIHTAAILGDGALVEALLSRDPGSVASTSEPYGGDPLVHLGLSKYLRLDRTRTPGFLRAAHALLEAGANPNTGFWNNGEFESALYGAAGVAHHPELTRLLLERGADPNDIEVVYHSPEGYDNAAMHLVVETGRVTPEHLSLMLIRKLDWHDYQGAKWLLEHGAPAGPQGERRWIPIHHALARDNGVALIELLLDHGADPRIEREGITAIARAAREGRGEVLQLFERRGFSLALSGVDELIAACALGETGRVRALVATRPELVAELRTLGGDLLAKFAGTGNAAGVAELLNAGIEVTAPFSSGDGYFSEPKDSLAIHVAAWRLRPAVVRLLLERGSPADVPDPRGRTPLELAERACVDSYWTERCSPELLELLRRHGAGAGR